MKNLLFFIALAAFFAAPQVYSQNKELKDYIEIANSINNTVSWMGKEAVKLEYVQGNHSLSFKYTFEHKDPNTNKFFSSGTTRAKIKIDDVIRITEVRTNEKNPTQLFFIYLKKPTVIRYVLKHHKKIPSVSEKKTTEITYNSLIFNSEYEMDQLRICIQNIFPNARFITKNATL